MARQLGCRAWKWGVVSVFTLYDAAVAEADQGLQADGTEDGDPICSRDKYQAGL